MTKYCSLKEVVLLFVGLVFSFVFMQQVNAAEVTETVKLYPYDELGMAGSPFPGGWAEVHSSEFGRRDNSTEEAFDVYTSANSFSDVIYRSFLTFNTSQIPQNAEISFAALNIVPRHVLNELNDEQSYIAVFASNQADPAEITFDDIELCGNSLIKRVTAV